MEEEDSLFFLPLSLSSRWYFFFFPSPGRRKNSSLSLGKKRLVSYGHLLLP